MQVNLVLQLKKESDLEYFPDNPKAKPILVLFFQVPYHLLKFHLIDIDLILLAIDIQFFGNNAIDILNLLEHNLYFRFPYHGFDLLNLYTLGFFVFQYVLSFLIFYLNIKFDKVVP